MFESAARFRDWLQANHETAAEVWIGYYKKGVPKTSVSYPESVDEALAFGWIDGITRRIDDEVYATRFTPRRKRSNWSVANVTRVGELTAAGRMHPAGSAAFEAALSVGSRGGRVVINAKGMQTNAIVIHVRSEEADAFEKLFAQEELPIWDEFHANGTLISASLTRVTYGSEKEEGVQDYVILAVFRGMAGHTSHDEDARFNAFLPKAKLMQSSGPYVWGGRTIHARPAGVASEDGS